MTVTPYTRHVVTPDLVRVLAVLGRTYTPEAIGTWWNNGNKGLDGVSPAEAWEYGAVGLRDEVRRIAYAIEAD